MPSSEFPAAKAYWNGQSSSPSEDWGLSSHSCYHCSKQQRRATKQTTETVIGKVHEDHFVPLCQRFMKIVHPTLPVLNGSEIEDYTRHCAASGLDCDGRSCLVLFICALALCTSPLTPVADKLDDHHPVKPDFMHAQYYFSKAQTL
ncbi:hypothetical protein CLAIMM_00050 isoform 2 [Cladophialophora immunda]|nr:hypothetical protein CLAIMM_00050 isoform 1 [Cladophialophora immunda]OQU93561.1 hypothetical protein CLAIMM_00050 isoform 2 [Cladophialophora immunda]